MLVCFIFIFSVQGCQSISEPIPENNSTQKISTLSKSYTVTNADLEIIAKNLAVFFDKIENRKILEHEISQAENKEKIIDASIFWNKERKNIVNNKSWEFSIADILSGNSNYDNAILTKVIKNVKYGMIDIYFPIDQHREIWNKNSDLLVAAVDHKEAKSKTGKIPAFNLGGSKIILDSCVIPKTPVLVVTKSELGGHYNNQSPNYANLGTLQNPHAPQSGFTDLKVGHVFLRDATWWDGPFGGDPEFYTLCWSPWNIANPTFTYFLDVTDGTEYQLDRTIFRQYGVVSGSTKIHWMEQDSPTLNSDDIVETEWGLSDAEPYFETISYPSYNYVQYWGRNMDLWETVKWLYVGDLQQ